MHSRQDNGIALLEAAAISALMLPLLFGVYGLGEYMYQLGAWRTTVEQALLTNAEAPYRLEIWDNQLRSREDREALDRMVAKTHRVLLEALSVKRIGNEHFKLLTFAARSSASSHAPVVVVEEGGLATPDLAAVRSQLTALLPAGDSLGNASYGIGAVLYLRFGSSGTGALFSALSGADRISISKIQRLRREVAWQR